MPCQALLVKLYVQNTIPRRLLSQHLLWRLKGEGPGRDEMRPHDTFPQKTPEQKTPIDTDW